MSKLILLNGDKPTTTSLIIAEVFEKQHKNILKDIKNLEVPPDFWRLNFELSDYLDSRGKKQPIYNITKDGFSILAMGFTGTKAMKFKLAFLEQFNSMEKSLNNDKTTWKASRGLGKSARAEITDAVKRLVDYATANGSKNAQKYYEAITLMEYRALNFIAGNPKCHGLRDMLEGRDLAQLMTLEYKCADEINKSIDKGMHYKDIYQHIKLVAINMCNQFVKNNKVFIVAQKRISS
jgi:Rha family phage regulatory protein